MGARLVPVLLNRLRGRVIRIAIIFSQPVRCPREWVGVVLAASLATVAATVALFTLRCCVQLVGPSDRVRFGRAFQVRKTLHPAREGATTPIAV